MPSLHSDSQVESHRRLVAALHKGGAAASAQVFFPELDYRIVIDAMRERGRDEAMAL